MFISASDAPNNFQCLVDTCFGYFVRLQKVFENNYLEFNLCFARVRSFRGFIGIWICYFGRFQKVMSKVRENQNSDVNFCFGCPKQFLMSPRHMFLRFWQASQSFVKSNRKQLFGSDQDMSISCSVPLHDGAPSEQVCVNVFQCMYTCANFVHLTSDQA